MSQPTKLSDYTEFLPKTEARRGPFPITSLPSNAMSGETDPTLEIRTLIEQLQQTARDSREHARSVEQERDTLALELARAQQQVDALRINERELRSHFVEVTSLIEERDTALTEAERCGHALAEARRKIEHAARERHDAQRQREEAIRQRDEAARKFETFHRSSEEQARMISETQKQLLTIRQARDGAHAQILDLNIKLGGTEDQLAELGYQHEFAQKAAKQAAAEGAEFRRQLDIVTTDRDATARQAEQLSAELDAQRQKYLDLAGQKSAALATDSEHVAALAEARTQVGSLAAERDAARTRVQEQTREIEDLRTQFQTFRDEATRTADTTLHEAHEKIAALETQAREGRHETNNLRQQLAAYAEQLTVLQTAAAAAAAQSDGTRQEFDALQRACDGALASLTAAQQQIDHLMRERDQIRQLANEHALEFETQSTALQARLAALQLTSETAAAQQEQLADMTARFEKRRLENIDLAAQLQTAQREIRELSATLAEARLQVKFASAASRAAKDGKTRSDFASLLVGPMAEAANGAAVLEAAAPAVTGLQEPLTEKEAKSTLGAMRHCFQSFTKTPTDLSLLNELHCLVQGFSERARVTELIALHRICNAFSDLTRGLYETPELVNPSTLRTVHQTIEFLAALMKEKNLAHIKDPATARIYGVDDDIGNCESIAMAMEESSMRTTYALEPAAALEELASASYDLIFLDVNLPGMDGFELCRKIRGLAHHETTPIAFLTGLATLENQLQSSLSGGNDFIAKPFNLSELSVKAITLILKAQLGLA